MFHWIRDQLCLSGTAAGTIELTASNSSWRCMCVFIKSMLWMVFSITNGSFLSDCPSSEPDISFWNPLKIESKCSFNCPLSLSWLPLYPLYPLDPLDPLELLVVAWFSSASSASVGSAWRRYLLRRRPWLALTTYGKFSFTHAQFLCLFIRKFI